MVRAANISNLIQSLLDSHSQTIKGIRLHNNRTKVHRVYFGLSAECNETKEKKNQDRNERKTEKCFNLMRLLTLTPSN